MFHGIQTGRWYTRHNSYCMETNLLLRSQTKYFRLVRTPVERRYSIVDKFDYIIDIYVLICDYNILLILIGH